MTSKVYSALIIGGGPAGCQCALWLKMLGHDPILVEQSDQLGGLQARSPYKNHWIVGMLDTTGRELARRMQQHVLESDIPVLFNRTVNTIHAHTDGFIVHVDKKAIETRYLIIATGVLPRNDIFTESDSMMIGPGERIYHFDFKGKRVAILGGGDNAFENYLFIKEKKPACCHVYVRTQRSRRNLTEKMDTNDVFSGPYQADQASMTVRHDNTQREYDEMIVLYGWEANFPQALEGFRNEMTDERGFIATDVYCATQVPRIYAIGEVANRMHPCVTTSMADGVVAAKAIQNELESAS